MLFGSVQDLVAALQCYSYESWSASSSAKLFVRVLVSLVISEVALKGWYRVRKASTFFRPAGIDHQSFIAQKSLLGRIRSKCLHGVPLAHRLVQPQLCVSRRMHSFQLMTSHWARNPSDAELEKGPKGPPDSRTRFP